MPTKIASQFWRYVNFMMYRSRKWMKYLTHDLLSVKLVQETDYGLQKYLDFISRKGTGEFIKYKQVAK